MARLRWLLRENPHIAARHFRSGNKLFRKIVLRRNSTWLFIGTVTSGGVAATATPMVRTVRRVQNPDMPTLKSRKRFAKVWGLSRNGCKPTETPGCGRG
jgi:hypothetical protein